MSFSFLFIIVVMITLGAFYLGRSRALVVAETCGGVKHLHSLPAHYGMLLALYCGLPSLLLLIACQFAESSVLMSLVLRDMPPEITHLPASQLSLVINEINNVISDNIVTQNTNAYILTAADQYHVLQDMGRNGFAIVIPLLGVSLTMIMWRKITPSLRARNIVERIIRYFLIFCSAIAILTTVGIVFSVLFESIRFFKVVPLHDFLFGLSWSPQTSIRSDQVGSSGAFGAVPVFAGTLLISMLAMLVAVPIGLMSAIYLSEYAGKNFRATAKPLLEILAGIPTVVYGFFAALTVAPFIRDTGALFNLSVSSESALAAGLVMGIMIIPFVSSLSDDVIHAVPQTLRDGAFGLGATTFETIRYVVIPAALPGIVGGILLAVSRAIGETMIVVMAAGLSANLTANPLKAVTTVTVQIVTLLVGDQEFDSPKTLAAFALGLLLFVVTLIFNIIALQVVRKYREQYE
jgi:phosphate transport system permease protein